MKTLLSLLLTLGALHATPEAIFNGKDLTGWKVEGAEYWSAKEGVLIGQSDAKKEHSNLWTEKQFTDFTLKAEFRYQGRMDSGVFVRAFNDQIQLGISSSLKRDMTCSPYIASLGKYPVEAKGVDKLLKEGEWNQLSITAKGPSYVVTLNGTQVLDYTSGTAKEKGPIGLQVHQGFDMKIEFRNLTVEAIGD